MLDQVGLFRFIKTLLLNPEKLANLLKVLVSFLFFKKGRIWGIPPVLFLEPTTFCQLTCPLCALQNPRFDSRRNQHLDLNLAHKIASEIGSKICMVILYNQGEPLLYPEIASLIEIFSKKNVIIKVSTNGHHPKKMNHTLVLSGLDHIIFDVDGDTQETYEQYRRDGNLKKVLENMRALSDVRRKLRKSKPFIEARFIAMQHNLEGIEEARRLSMEYGADQFKVKKCMSRKEEEFAGANNFIPTDFNRLPYETPNSCGYLYIFFMILSNGQTSPCCYDEYGEYTLGDISETTIEENLNSKAFMSLRHNVRTVPAKDPKRLELCQSCDLDSRIWSGK